MHIKIFRGNSKQIEIQHITSKLSAGKKWQEHEPSQLAQLVKAHHKKDFSCRFYLYIEQLVFTQRTFCFMVGDFGP